nr:type I restriction endonuclease subunit R [bacterium]
SRLRPALERLNPDLSGDAIKLAIEEITKSRSVMSLAEANREVYRLIKDGVKVTVNDPDGEGETSETIRVIDWASPENNDFFLASQFWISGEMYTRRPDLLGFVNGLPLVFIELKGVDKKVEAAYKDNLTDYKDTIPQLFWCNALIILSNGTDSRMGSLTSSWEHFAEWKKINSEGEEGVVSLETVLRGICDHERLLDIVENYTLFMEAQGGLQKIVCKNHQYLGVNNTFRALEQIQSNQGRLGVFWHTQGSGKSVSMVFFAQKVLRQMKGNWTFVVVTDRIELDNQIYKTFASSGAVTQKEVHAESVEHLRQLLREDHRYIFTLIHKFRTNQGEKHPVLSDRSDIIVITDEAHRSQYDTLALNMRTALPNASFIAFTGTPLLAGEEKTRQVFGDYVSIYDFKQSIDDGATVPLYYENRVPRLRLTNEELNEDLEQLLEAAELDDTQEEAVEYEFAREYHLITREDRLETIAEDIVSHFMGRGYRGKAMVVSIDKATAVKTYDKVQKYWERYLEELKAELSYTTSSQQREALEDKICYMEETDMAVVVSQAQNEIQALAKKGVDIVPHRRRIVNEDLDTKFKDPEDPFRIVFVCAMWMTGFDVPPCSTIYLDKPQRNHTLMQTIARANRVFQGKVNGLIVDYIGVFRDLEKALSIYAPSPEEGKVPIRNKYELVERLKQAIAEVTDFCSNLDIDLAKIEQAAAFERIKLIADAENEILINDETKRQYLQLASDVSKLYKAILPDPIAGELVSICSLVNIIALKIKEDTQSSGDISDVMPAIEEVLDASIEAEWTIDTTSEEAVDLSQIDFDQLREKFKAEHKRIEAEKLRGAINKKLSQMIRVNKTRMDYQDKFEKMIFEYNEGIIDVDVFFTQLITFVRELNEEDQRSIAEQLTDEELTVFDLLIRPKMELSESEKSEVKAIAQKLLETLKQEKLVLDWRKQQRARASVRLTIEDTLDELPECYTQEIYNQKCEVIYQHVYDSYYGLGDSIFKI